MFRVCDKCGKVITQGYFDGVMHYCEECLPYSEECWAEMCDENLDCYWSDWFEEGIDPETVCGATEFSVLECSDDKELAMITRQQLLRLYDEGINEDTLLDVVWFDSEFNPTMEETGVLSDLIQCLDMKEGADLIEIDYSALGFLAYNGDKTSGFAIKGINKADPLNSLEE